MIELEEVTKRFGPVRAVDGVTLRVAAGECLGFIGPNGAGKTTTIRLLAGLLRPSGGRVAIGGHDVAREPRAAKQITGYVPDRPYLYEKLTGREFVRFVGELYGLARREVDLRAAELFERLGLGEEADSLIESYSHGMRQKTVIASALVHHPRALVIDEPMVGLDPRSARTVKDLFRTACEEGMALFLSTHSLDVAEEICHRLAIVRKGRLIASGTMEDLRRQAREGSDLESVFLRLTEETPQAAAEGAGESH